MVWSGWSLRTKLVVTCVLVQMAAAALLIGVSTQILQRTVLEQARSEIRQVVVLLDQAIAAPMAQRDYATLQQTLDLVRSDESIVYLVLQDHRGKRIAASGWDPARALPPRDGQDIDLRRADTTLHLSMPINLAGQALGRADLGLSTLGLREARADFLRQSLSVGAAALVLSTLALAGLAYAITRHLARLALASQRVGQGEFDVQVPVTTHDEIGHLGASFNAMASALKQRVQALEESRAQQREHLDEARTEQSRLTTLLGAMRGGIVFVDEHGKLIYANASFARIWSLGELTAGTMLPDVVQRMLPQVDPAHVGYLEAMCQRGASEQRTGAELHTLDGRIITQRVQPVAQAGSSSGCIWFHDDITQERQTQQRAHQALHDPLTGLYNRRGFYESLQLALAQAAMDRTPTSLLFIDLDDFKHANDVAGHRVGDEILVAVARALTGQMRKGELVGRLGGDEFAVLCPGIPAEGAGAIAARLVTAISALQWEAAGQILHVGCSVGVATCPLDASMADELVACADAAMYEAKAAGKNGWAAYRDDPSRSESEAVRVNWNAQIHRALQEQRFVLHFQSVHRASDSRIAYYEALVRMVDESDPARVILPAEFVTRAEASGKIRLIDRWVFEACIKRLAGMDGGVCIAEIGRAHV